MSYFVHESSYIDDNVSIGEGTKIWHFCHVHKGAQIGEKCSLGQNVNVSNNVKIGNGVRSKTTYLSMKVSNLKIMYFVALLWFLLMI